MAWLAVPITAAASQGTSLRIVRGAVTDTSGQPVPFANVSTDARQRVLTNYSGEFSLSLATGKRVTVDVRRIGFHPTATRFTVGADTALSVQLMPLPRYLPTVVTAATAVASLDRRGFYRRMADRERGINSGHFITAEDIERRNPTRITQMLEGIPSVHVRPQGRCQRVTQCFVPTSSTCYMQVFVDGQRITRLQLAPNESPWGDGRAQIGWLDDVALPSHVAGVEVYAHASTAPPEFQSLAGCGVILFWTK